MRTDLKLSPSQRQSPDLPCGVGGQGQTPASDCGGGAAEAGGDGAAHSDVSLLQSLLRPAAECAARSASPGWPLRPHSLPASGASLQISPLGLPNALALYFLGNFARASPFAGKTQRLLCQPQAQLCFGVQLKCSFSQEAFPVSPVQVGFPHLCTLRPCSPPLLERVVIMCSFFWSCAVQSGRLWAA